MVPGQMQQSASPAITNRAPSTIPPTGYPPVFGPPQYPGTFEQQQNMQAQQPAYRIPSYMERNEFQNFVLQSVGRDLPMFGYNLFQNPLSTFAPADRVPVTPEYVVGPGDELLVRAWGQVDIDYRAVVDRDGSISIPKIGNINVSGIKFQDLQPYLKTAIGRVFRNFDLNVAMGQLRSVQVFVVGQVVKPGAYTVSSLSTLVNAVFASGGPTYKGSMRNIQLKRRDKLVTEFDMYDLLLKGDKSKDVQLLPGDVIFIPPIGQLAAISGSINNPAIYEIKGPVSLAILIELSGGLTTTADGQKVTVERIVDRKARQVEDFKLDSTGMARALRDGDLVQVLPLSPRFDNAITVRGNVAVPARHPWRAGLRVKDVVPDKEALIVPDYWVKRNLIVRRDVTGREVYGSRTDIAAEMRYGVRPEADDPRYGFRPDVLPDPRQQPAQGQPLGQNQQPGQNAQSDQLARRNADARNQQRLRTDIKQSLPEVNWDYAVVERLNLTDLTTTLLPFNLGKAILEADPQNNVVLQPGDVITIFSKDDIQVPIAKQTKFVRLEGEVAAPGVYQVQAGETLRQLLVRVGGLSPNAYLFGATFNRESTRMLQQKRLDEAIDKLEQEIHRSMSQTALTKEDTENLKTAGQGQLALVARLRSIRATGRIVLEVPPERGSIAALPDLALEDADTLTIPARPSTVAVVGTVYNENSFIYRPEKRASDYLAQAGGPTKDADTDSFYIIRADGSVISKRQSSWFSLSGFDGERLNPGDAVVVPEKLDKYRFTRELKDWSAIFYQFALGVAGLKVLQGL
jgi:polysaccharide export outer membrane protein